MKILVTVKRIPDPEQKIKFKGNVVDYTATNWMLNQFDEYAVETALRLTENAATPAVRNGEVIVVSVAPKDAAQQLRSALAMGADRAILIDGSDDNLDAETVAALVAKVVAQEKPDVVIMGKLAGDSEGNQVGQILAAKLGWPQACFAASIEVQDAGKSMLVGREADSGTEMKKVPLPAVVTVDLRIISPKAIKNGVTAADHAYPDGARFASLKGIMAARKKPIVETTAAALGVTAQPLVKIITVEAPTARTAGIKVGSVQELVDKLHNTAKVI